MVTWAQINKIIIYCSQPQHLSDRERISSTTAFVDDHRLSKNNFISLSYLSTIIVQPPVDMERRQNRTIIRTIRQYVHFVMYHPRLICRIMAWINGIFFLVISTICLCNIWQTKYLKEQPSSTSKPSNDDMTFGLDSQISIGLIYKDEDKLITKSFHNFIITGIMFLVNLHLVMATYQVFPQLRLRLHSHIKRSFHSIFTWLFVHTTHMLYSLSINLWFGISNSYYSLICLALVNTMLYLLFISIVVLFWLEERRTIRILKRAKDLAASNQGRIAVIKFLV